MDPSDRSTDGPGDFENRSLDRIRAAGPLDENSADPQERSRYGSCSDQASEKMETAARFYTAGIDSLYRYGRTSDIGENFLA